MAITRAITRAQGGTGTATRKANSRVTVVRAAVTHKRPSRAVMEVLHREVGTVAHNREDTVGPKEDMVVLKEGTVDPKEDTVARSRVGMAVLSREAGVNPHSRISSVASPGREAGSRGFRVAVEVAVVAAARVLELSRSAETLVC